MSNKLIQGGVEPKCYACTNTLINHLNIRDPDRLAQKEADFSLVRGIELLQAPPIELLTFDYSALRAIHYHLFQDLYDWAGQPRSFNFRKGGDEFMPSGEFDNLSEEIFRDVDALDVRLDVSQQFASLPNKINFFHPFPEGNGRSQRIFLSILAKKYHYDINWSAVQAWEMKVVCQQAYIMNLDPMQAMFARILEKA